MLSSYQDTFIPFYSERAEVTPQIEQSTKEELTILSEMVTNFWRDLKKPESLLQILGDYFNEVNTLKGDLYTRNKKLQEIHRNLLRKFIKK